MSDRDRSISVRRNIEVVCRIMIYMISDGAKSGTEGEEKHCARFLPFNIPLKGNLAWNPWHVWWNSTAPCVQWNSPQALDCRCVCVCVYSVVCTGCVHVLVCGLWMVHDCVCFFKCVSPFLARISVVFHWGKSTLSISCHVWLPSVVTDNTVGSGCGHNSQLVHYWTFSQWDDGRQARHFCFDQSRSFYRQGFVQRMC